MQLSPEEIASKFQKMADDISLLSDQFNNHQHRVGFGDGLRIPRDQVGISETDTSYGFLNDKLTAGSGITLTVLNGGGVEQLEISTNPLINTVNMVVGASISALNTLYEDQYGFHGKADSDTYETVNRFKGIASEARVGATESGVGAGSAHEHYSITSATDYAASNTSPATIIAAGTNTNTSNLDSSNDTDYQTSTTTAGQYCYQLIQWDADATVVDTIRRLKVLVEASAGGTGQTNGFDVYIWDKTNSQWDLVGGSSLTYSTDETVTNAVEATDYLEATTNFVYVLIKTKGSESGGVNALKLDVDYASLTVGVNCAVYIRGDIDITSLALSASDIGKEALVSGTAGGITTGYVKIRKSVGLVASSDGSTADTLILDFDREVVYKPTFLIPTKSTITTTTPNNIFGQSSTSGRIAHIYLTSATVYQGVDAAPFQSLPLQFSVHKQYPTTSDGSVTSGDTIYDTCVVGSSLVLAVSRNPEIRVYPITNQGAATWTVNDPGAVAVCSDGSWVYWYDQAEDKIKKATLASGGSSSSIAAGFTNEQAKWCGMFYYNSNVYTLVYGDDGAGNVSFQIGKVATSTFASNTVTTLWSDTRIDVGNALSDQTGFAKYNYDFIMPYNDGLVYLVTDFGNIKQASALVDLNAF